MAGRTSEELEELRRKVQASEVKRAEKARAADEAREGTELEERLLLVDLESKYGLLGHDIAALFSPKDGRMIVVKTPTAVAFQRFQERILSNKPLTSQHMIELIYPCLVHPEKAGYESIVDAAPGMMAAVANAITTLAGVARENAEGK